MSRLFASVIFGSLSACGSALPQSLPPIADKLPSNVHDAELEFDRRVKAAFPVGTLEKDAAEELENTGFQVTSHSSDGYRSADI